MLMRSRYKGNALSAIASHLHWAQRVKLPQLSATVRFRAGGTGTNLKIFGLVIASFVPESRIAFVLLIAMSVY